jgi:hypothetical protein
LFVAAKAAPEGNPAMRAIDPSVPAWRMKSRRSKKLFFISVVLPFESTRRREQTGEIRSADLSERL